MAAIKPNERSVQAELRQTANQFFNPQLEALGLGREQLLAQNMAELEESLARVNDALKNPESFGVLRLKTTASAAIVVSSTTESQFEVGVVPLLLDRKKIITERLRQLRGPEALVTTEMRAGKFRTWVRCRCRCIEKQFGTEPQTIPRAVQCAVVRHGPRQSLPTLLTLSDH